MPNTPIEITPYPTATKEDIEDLISFFDTMYNEEYPHQYNVSELYTDNNGTLPLIYYELKNITMELEKGILIVSDSEEKLWNEKHYLHTILAEDLDYITYNEELQTVTLTIGNDRSYGIIIRIFY
jgi:hypothetical protein